MGWPQQRIEPIRFVGQFLPTTCPYRPAHQASLFEPTSIVPEYPSTAGIPIHLDIPIVTEMNIVVNDDIMLSSYSEKDAAQLTHRIGHKSIADMTLTIPYPYDIEDAEMFIHRAILQDQGPGQRNWGIRLYSEGLIGGIGIHYKYGPKSHKDEIGYWLSPDFWGKGIMSEVVGKFVNRMAETRNLVRFEAPVFASNTRSSKVLENNGFRKEGLMKMAYHKNGNYYDALLFAKTISV